MFGFKRTFVKIILLLLFAIQFCTFDSVVLWYILASSFCVVCALAVLTYDHDYWKGKGIFSPPAWPLVGHIRTVVAFKEQGGMCFKRIYDTYKNEKILGK